MISVGSTISYKSIYTHIRTDILLVVFFLVCGHT